MNKELNRSDAFVAAWLPGTEGGGVADTLTGRSAFTGKLSYSWPKSACQSPLNRGDAGYDPLFPVGYGLTSGQTGNVGQLDETSHEFPSCTSTGGGGTATEDLDVFVRTDVDPTAASSARRRTGAAPRSAPTARPAHAEINTVPRRRQRAGRRPEGDLDRHRTLARSTTRTRRAAPTCAAT